MIRDCCLESVNTIWGHSVPHLWEEGKFWVRQVGGMKDSTLLHPFPLCDAEKVENCVLNNNSQSNYQTAVIVLP